MRVLQAFHVQNVRWLGFDKLLEPLELIFLSVADSAVIALGDTVAILGFLTGVRFPFLDGSDWLFAWFAGLKSLPRVELSRVGSDDRARSLALRVDMLRASQAELFLF